MFDFLQPSSNPVIWKLESIETVFAKQQPQYNPLRTIVGTTNARPVLSRWTLTEEQRLAVLDGADIYLELLTFGGPLQPIRVAIGLDVSTEYICEQYGLVVPPSNLE